MSVHTRLPMSLRDIFPLVWFWLMRPKNQCRDISLGLILAGGVLLSVSGLDVINLVVRAYIQSENPVDEALDLGQIAGLVIISFGCILSLRCLRREKGYLRVTTPEPAHVEWQSDERRIDPDMLGNCLSVDCKLIVGPQKGCITRFVLNRYVDGMPCIPSRTILSIDGISIPLNSKGNTVSAAELSPGGVHRVRALLIFGPPLVNAGYHTEHLRDSGDLEITLCYRFSDESKERPEVRRFYRHVPERADGRLAYNFLPIKRLAPPPRLNDGILRIARLRGWITRCEANYIKRFSESERWMALRKDSYSGLIQWSKVTVDDMPRLKRLNSKICAGEYNAYVAMLYLKSHLSISSQNATVLLEKLVMVTELLRIAPAKWYVGGRSVDDDSLS